MVKFNLDLTIFWTTKQKKERDVDQVFEGKTDIQKQKVHGKRRQKPLEQVCHSSELGRNGGVAAADRPFLSAELRMV